MRKRLFVPSFIVAACLATIGLGAQEANGPALGQSGPRTAAPSAAPPTTAGKKVTLSGCIERQPEGQSAAAATSPFTLTKAAPAPIGTAGEAASKASAKTYRLDAAESMIAPHVGHKVELTGTVDEQAGASPTNVPKMKVESLKMVSTTCQ